MKQGKARFHFQLQKIEQLITKAKNQENPALWLFLHDMRTPLFMLEGLSKMYAQLHDKKIFTLLNENFKEAEDVLGAIDYYAAFSREFVFNDKIPTNIKTYLENKTKEKIELFNQMLKRQGWLMGKIQKSINTNLEKVNWLREEDEVIKINDFYYKQIKKIHLFIEETTYQFDDVENDVHELRRKLRWLSIYPQALQGVIILKDEKATTDDIEKYLSEEIINSPFNVFPISNDVKHHLILEKNHFLALSWVIAKLGKIKDTGLKIRVLKESFQETAFLKDEEAMQETYHLLGEEYPKMEQLLIDAAEITEDFFDDKILDNLVLGFD